MSRVFSREQPFVIAGPCMAESEDLLHQVAIPLSKLAQELGFKLIFKASFDKANRTSSSSTRGPGLQKTMDWFTKLKKATGLPVLTDVHESNQCAQVAEVCDVLQIPAFLCRQSDLLVAAVVTGREINVKKGQFLAPSGVQNIVDKCREAATGAKMELKMALTERGTSFGYGDLVVDPRSFQIMARTGVPVVFDVTHSLQQPAATGDKNSVSGGLREFAPSLTRAAIATGYIDGLFLEVHPEPAKAMSDAATQLNLKQAEALLRMSIPMMKSARQSMAVDKLFS